MNGPHLIRLLKMYNDALYNRGVVAVRTKDKDIPLQHIQWMCMEMWEKLNRPQHDSAEAAALIAKGMRWLGFIQGVLWREGVFTIDEMRDHNTTNPNEDYA